MNQKYKSALMVSFLVLVLGLLDLIAVQTSYAQMYILAWIQVIGAAAVIAYVAIKEYA